MLFCDAVSAWVKTGHLQQFSDLQHPHIGNTEVYQTGYT